VEVAARQNASLPPGSQQDRRRSRANRAERCVSKDVTRTNGIGRQKFDAAAGFAENG